MVHRLTDAEIRSAAGITPANALEETLVSAIVILLDKLRVIPCIDHPNVEARVCAACWQDATNEVNELQRKVKDLEDESLDLKIGGRRLYDH